MPAEAEEAVRDPVVVAADLALSNILGKHPVPASLRPPVLADQVGGDPEQPGPHRAAGGVERVPLAERVDEGVGRQIAGCLQPEPAGYVLIDVGEVPVVDLGEPVWGLP